MDQHKIHHLQPKVRIGKAGISKGIIEEANQHLKKSKLVKVRLLKSFLTIHDSTDVVKHLEDKTQSSCVQHRGNTIVLYKP